MVAVHTQMTMLREAPSKRAPTGPLALMTATLVAPTEQPATQGLAFTLELKNDGDAPIVIHNPLDALGILITDAKGFPLSLLPGPPARIAINTRGPMRRSFP